MKLDRKKVVPHLKQKTIVPLYLAEGKTYSARDFAIKYKALLSTHEQKFIQKQSNKINNAIPKYLADPLAIIKNIDSKIIFSVKSIGSRSAFLSAKKIKLKGCKPNPDLYFPHEQLNFGEIRMTTTKILFGALSAENIMREMLAYCFFRENKLPIFQEPLVVFEYTNKNKNIGYCLAFQSPSEIRLESREDFKDLKIKDVITNAIIEKSIGRIIGNKEASFKRISPKWYSKYKGRLLAKMNFSGGFRGILNSNIGNDIEHNNKFYICDFDTFKVINIPIKPSKIFIKKFCLWCLAELLKTSPLIMDYVDIERASKNEATLKIWDIYRKNSSLWREYSSLMHKWFIKNNWNLDYLDKAISTALKTDVIHDLILDNVINSKLLKNSYKPEQSFYIPHNY